MKTAAWLAGLALALSALALTLGSGGAQGGEAALSAANGRIAFASFRDGNWEIYVMNPNGSGQANLTNNPARDLAPVWSPDGSKIAFESYYRYDSNYGYSGNYGHYDYELYLMNPDGSGQTRITYDPATDGMPTWSPDGKRIAFVSSRDRNYEIYVMNADGSGQTNLSKNPADDAEPAWSPNGSKIAFRSNPGGGRWQIYLMNPDGSGQTNLTVNPAADYLEPAWSPNGAKIAFRSNRDGNFELYVMNADGSGLTRLTNHPADDKQPTWSPDGAKIAFITDRDGNDEVYVMNADGSGLTRLTNTPAHEYGPNWGPQPAAGAPTPAPVPTPTTDLVLGWNYLLYSGATLPVEQALGECLAAVDAVFVWDAAAVAWLYWLKAAPPSGVNTLATLSQGAIPWVHASAACNWGQPSARPSPSPPPAGPGY